MNAQPKTHASENDCTMLRAVNAMKETHSGHWNDVQTNDVFVDVRDYGAIFSTRCGLHEIHPNVTQALARAEQFLAGGE